MHFSIVISFINLLVQANLKRKLKIKILKIVKDEELKKGKSKNENVKKYELLRKKLLY